MKNGEPDKVAKVKGLLRKLGELAEILDDISRKMRLAAEKQQASIDKIRRPSRETTQLLNALHEQLSDIDHATLTELQISKAKDLSKRLIDISCDVSKEPLRKMTFHEYVEFSSLDEFKKFRTLPAINKRDLKRCNWDDLMLDLYNRCDESGC